MRLLSFLSVALLPAALANNLRHANPCFIECPEEEVFDDNLTPKAAPVEFPPRSYSSQYENHRHRRLNAATINSAVARSLPTINALMQSQIPDPIPLSESTVTTFSDSSTCGGSTIDCSYSTTEFVGVSGSEITSLTVQEGTESFQCGCGTSSFSGTFDLVLSNPSGYAVVGTSQLAATSCTTYDSSFTGAINNPVFNGVVTLAGDITCNSATFTSYSIDTLTVTCDSTSATFGTAVSGSDFAAVENTFTQSLGDDMKNTLANTVITTVRNAIDMALANTFVPLGIGGGVPYIMAFYRSAAEQQIQGWQDQISTLAGRGQKLLGNFGDGPAQRV